MRFAGILILSAAAMWGQSANDLAAPGADDLTQAQIQEIIEKFAAREAEFARARESYTYRQSARLQELDSAGGEQGRWEMVSDIIFEASGRRTERVVRAPVPTLKSIIMTPEDEQDLRNIQPFVLTTANLDDYYIRYLGRETLDEIPCYTFAVKPKKLEKDRRYFSGIVWVDDLDLQIVKTYGRGVGIAKGQAFAKFETYRQQIDGKYWFPTYTIAEDTLHFANSDQRIRQIVKYENYAQFKATSTITFGGEVEGETPAPAPAPAEPPAEPAKP